MVSRIARHLRGTAELLPDGARLTVERFQMVGSFLGGNTRVDALHHLLEDAFVRTPDGDRLSDAFLEQVHGLVSRAANPLYALMHESIYGQGGGDGLGGPAGAAGVPGVPARGRRAAADRRNGVPLVLRAGPGAAAAAAMWRNCWPRKSDWPPLYDAERLALNTVPVAAAVYSDDIYVDRELSLETAAAVRGLQVWETADFHHDGIADDGEAIFGRLLGMVRSAAS